LVAFSFVVPIYNDGYLADAFACELERVLREYLSRANIAGEVELIFVDDGSESDSTEALRAVCDKLPFVRVINLSRNFGQHVAVSCGYRHAEGRVICMLNVDMEDPPAEIPKLLEALKSHDYDIVYGIYDNKPNKLGSLLFHYLLNRLTGYRIPANTSTLRVMNRRFLEAYNALVEKSRYLPGLEMWLGFRRGYVPVRHQPRKVGKSSYDFRRRMRMAVESIISFSDLPLRMVVAVGFAFALLGFILIVLLVVQKLLFIQFLPGYISTVVVIMFFGGLQICVIGMASLYIGRILREVQDRPLYVVRDTYRGAFGPSSPASAPSEQRNP
jgi:glycosyltransferase involved in cell wall biosynthesis